jgi:pimeloyl-ACP methyl ester carboxylesterase
VALAAVLAGCSGDADGSPAPSPTPSVAATSSAQPSPSSVTDPETVSASPSPPPTVDAPEGLARYYAQRPLWKRCGDGMRCATVEVPLDYDAPDGESIELSVARRPASDTDRRLGSLLVNPGGPGASGVDYARDAEYVVSDALLRRYDIVGFDPRGVGDSTPVTCLSDRRIDTYLAADGSPDDRSEERQLVTLARGLARGCAEESGPLLAHVGTEDAARDMDVLRAAVGDERLNFLGKSYGTFLGATYAELFPDRVGRLVLDGALDPRRSSEEVNLEQAKGFEVALRAFVDDCLAGDDCPLPGGRAAALRTIDGILARADERPLRSDEGRPVTQALVLLGIVASLYDEEGGWPVLALALEEALEGDGSTLLALADYYTDREDGTYLTNANEAIYAVTCVDRPEQDGVAAVRRLAKEYAAESPRFGSYLAWTALPCTFWPVPPQGEPGPLRARGAAPILVIGTLRDPATPYAWAVGLAEQLESGVLLAWDGDGHTAYLRGSDCVNDAVDAYLLRGDVPVDGKRCR